MRTISLVVASILVFRMPSVRGFGTHSYRRHHRPCLRKPTRYPGVPNESTTARSLTLSSLSTSPIVWAAGHALGGILGVPAVAKATKTWYKKIDLPSWTPPDFVFGPTWTFLYASMGVAACRVYQRTSSLTSSGPLLLWMVHYLVLNLTWAPVFFGKQRLRLGMILNVLMLVTLGILIPLFYRNNPLSGLLLLPYLAWLTFATALNNSICRRNPTQNGYNEAMLQADLIQLQSKAAEYAAL